MTWVYDSALTQKKDQVRFLIGDTDYKKPLLEDEEIEFLLVQHGSVNPAAAPACEAIAAKLGRSVNRTVGNLRIEFEKQFEHYKQLARDFREGRMGTGASVAVAYAGGISKSDKMSVEQDSDREKPAFSKGMHDFASQVGTSEDSK